MDLRGVRILIPGTAGQSGRALAVRLHTLGTRTARADHDHDVLVGASVICANAPVRTFDAVTASAPSRTADHPAGEAALATRLAAVHRPQTGRSAAVPEMDLPHMATGFAARAVVMTRSGAGPALEVVR
ncbi:hypothetical protein [Streptomyces sp. NPDC059272]|uniref:hypothetical protein n=1 Tax=Streptomyces sp. NPDC059272 TaxID=3346800 RepID=UPI0036C97920